MKSTTRLSLAAVAVLIAAPQLAHAQATAPVIAPLSCDKPIIPVGALSVAESNRLQKSVDAYKSCVNDYSKSNQQKAAELSQQAQAYQDAANKAVDTFNDFAHELNDKSKK